MPAYRRAKGVAGRAETVSHKEPVSGAQRDARGRLLPGHTAGGRPKEAHDLKEWARNIIETRGKSVLRDMIDQEGEDRRFALRALLEYGYGKPQQHVDLTTGGQPLIKRISDADAELLGLPEP